MSDRDLSIDTLTSSLARSPPAIALAMTVYKVVRCIVPCGGSYYYSLLSFLRHSVVVQEEQSV